MEKRYYGKWNINILLNVCGHINETSTDEYKRQRKPVFNEKMFVVKIKYIQVFFIT